MVSVTLSADEIKFATDIAQKRNSSQRSGLRKDGKVLSDSVGIDIQGAIAELAVSKFFEIPWDGSFFKIEDWFSWRVDGHDVSGLEVRSTYHPNGSLLLHPKDKDDSPFVLVLTHKKPEIILAGWDYGFSGKKDQYWRDVGYGRPCYFLPQNKLKPISELSKMVKERANGV